MYFTKKNLALPLIISIAFLGGIYLYSAKNKEVKNEQNLANSNKQIQTNLTPSPSPDPYLVDEDGIFIDYRNGYKFTYPKETFKSGSIFSYDTGFSKGLFIPSESGTELIYLNYGVSSSPVSEEDYNKYQLLPMMIPLYASKDYESKPKYEWPMWNRMKIKEISNQGLTGLIMYSYPTGGGEGEMTWAYTAWWNENDKTISISMTTDRGEQFLKGYKSTFDSIVNSLQRVEIKH